jgi:hypothetical protein
MNKIRSGLTPGRILFFERLRRECFKNGRAAS